MTIQQNFEKYIQSISTKFSYLETSEMGYRSDLENLLKNIFESINVSRIDHDAKTQNGNKPDFVIVKHDIPILYIEAKDFGVSLDKVEKSEQMSRYFGYGNLVLTDYTEFRFYRNGISYCEPIKIADYDIRTRAIISKSQKFEFLTKTLIDFTKSYKEPIKSGSHLAKIMGGKAQRIRDNIREILINQTDNNSQLMKVYETIRRLLVQDLTKEAFADMYSQTLVYGLFVARFYDKSLDSFSRGEARDLLPESNPFLGNFFDHIAGRNFEKRLSFIVDELCEVFSHSNVAQLMEQHFKSSSKKGVRRGQDQVIHFYEDFLKEYDEILRKKMGAYYTPLPVVQFIVRSVDYLLENEFQLPGGLSNSSKNINGLHKVQILDPAVGTGTFISDVIGKIYSRFKKDGQIGRWPSYVHHDLLPRLFGFELMMAPYTIAHLKLSMALKETGFLYFNETREGKARLGIYLTNSLEDLNKQPELLAFDFGASIAQEAKEASKIKNEKPIMVVVGNPPYSVSSSNKGEWIQNLIKEYKTNLDERNIQPLSDDYIKFIRFSEHFVEKNGSGIVAMITNNSFLDGVIHRQMRKHLVGTFDDIYILDLHGNSKKKETAPDGGKDENVFDIQQGVSINIFIKKGGAKKYECKVHYSEFYGKRSTKFDRLDQANLKDIKWEEIKYSDPYYFFVPKDFKSQEKYNRGFAIDELFLENKMGLATGKDSEYIFFAENEASPTLHEKLEKIHYRPFDTRYVYYDVKKLQRARFSIMKNYLDNRFNLGLNVVKQSKGKGTEVLSSRFLVNRDFITNHTYTFPLYLYREGDVKVPNLKSEIVREIEEISGKVNPEDIYDYVYAVLHSTDYRSTYGEFLKIDLPRIPLPSSKDNFFQIKKLGNKLRILHLFESSELSRPITTYPVIGSDSVEKIAYKDGNVFINSDQYFGKVPEIAWNFWIGGYQPAQKWLKDRKGRNLTNEDIEHYQKIITVLVETTGIMNEINRIAP